MQTQEVESACPLKVVEAYSPKKRRRPRRPKTRRDTWVLCASLILAIHWFLPPLFGQSLEEFRRQTETLTREERLLEALEVVEAGLRQYPQALELLLQQGTLLLQLGHVQDARRALGKALYLAPEDSRVLAKAAESEMRRGRFEAAVTLFRRALQDDAAAAETHYRLAYTLFLKGEDEKALKEAEIAVMDDPVQPRFRLFLASLLNLQGRPDQAYRELLAAHRLDPRNPSTLFRLSSVQQGRGNLGQALELAELAQQLDPENPLYHRRLANLYRALGDPGMSREWEKRAQALERAFLIYGQSLRLMQQGRIREASLLMEETTARNPEFVSGWALLAQLYQKLGKEQRAIEAYRTVLKQQPGQRQAIESGAFLQLSRGSLDLALEMLRTQDDEDINRGLVLGYQLMSEGNWQEAFDLFSSLQETNPLSTDLIRLMSFCASELGRQEEALALLDKVRSLNPDNPEMDALRQRLVFEQALRHQRLGQWDRASRLLRQLVRQNPAESLYQLNLGYSLQQQGELAQAVVHYRSGLQEAPAQTWARQNLASSLYRLQRYGEAAAEYQRLVEGDHSQFKLQLGLCYSHMGRDPEAEAIFAEAVESAPTPELLYNLGITRLRLLKLDEAWKLIREAARQGYPPAQQLMRKSARR